MDSYLSGIISQNKSFSNLVLIMVLCHSGRKSTSTVAKYLFSLLCEPSGKDLKLWFWPLQQLSTCPQVNPRFITLQSFLFREEKRSMEKEHHEYLWIHQEILMDLKGDIKKYISFVLASVSLPGVCNVKDSCPYVSLKSLSGNILRTPLL